MNSNRFASALVVGVVAMALSGCGRKNPVDEISIKQSGISVIDRQRHQSPAWPAWRGPTGDGIVSDRPLLTTWSESTNVAWRADVPGRGHGSPIVINDSVYLTTAIEDKQIQQMMAFDRSSGDVKWTTKIQQGGLLSRGEMRDKGTNANGTIACDGQHLYIAFLNGDRVTASAVDFSGEIIWQREIGKFVSKFGYAPSPILYKSLVIFAADNSGGGYIAALDGKTGEIAWRVARDNVSTYSSPAIANVGGRDQLLISGCDAVTSYDPQSGNQNWKTACTTESTCGTIVTTSELIFASGGYPEKETVCLDAGGKQVWSNRTKIYEPSLVVVGDQVVAVSDDGVAYCWDAKSGDPAWKQRLGGKFSASPIVCNQLVYVPNLSGDTFVFSTAGDRYTLVAKNKLGNDCYASPAVADGQLFLRIGVGAGPNRREQLVCLAEPAASEPAE